MQAEDEDGYLSWCGDPCHFEAAPGRAVWNAVMEGEVVGSIELTLFRSLPALIGDDPDEAANTDFDGPFFHMRDDPDQPVLLLQGVYVAEPWRGEGVGSKLIKLAGSFGFPLYAEFANAELGEHCRRSHPPLSDAASVERRLASAAVQAARAAPLAEPVTATARMLLRDRWFGSGIARGLSAEERNELAASTYLGPLLASPERFGLAAAVASVCELEPDVLALDLDVEVERPRLLAAAVRLALYRASFSEPELDQTDAAVLLKALLADANPRRAQAADLGLQIVACEPLAT